MRERARVAGKTSGTRLCVEEAALELGVTTAVLREQIRKNAVPHERDERGRVYVLVGASSNVQDPDHNRRRKSRDAAIVGDLRVQASELRAAPEPPRRPGKPEEPGAPGVPPTP